MLGRINGIKRFEIHDGPGIRTTLFMKGCPLNCLWCHNPENIAFQKELYFLENKCVQCKKCQTVCPLHSFTENLHMIDRTNCVLCSKCVNVCPTNALGIYGKDVTVNEILPVLLEDRDYYEPGGVTISGGEPLMQSAFCEELLKALKEQNIHTAVDTCLYANQKDLEKLLPYTDIFLVDVKAIDHDVHKNLTGKDNTVILQNLDYLQTINFPVEIRVPYIPKLNESQMPKIAEYLTRFTNITGIKILPYHDFYKSKALSIRKTNDILIEKPSKSQLENVKLIFKERKLNVLED